MKVELNPMSRPIGLPFSSKLGTTRLPVSVATPPFVEPKTLVTTGSRKNSLLNRAKSPSFIANGTGGRRKFVSLPLDTDVTSSPVAVAGCWSPETSPALIVLPLAKGLPPVKSSVPGTKLMVKLLELSPRGRISKLATGR
jgi:hypothetical protein